MDLFFNEQIITFIRDQDFFAILVVIYFISTLTYWLSSKQLGKRRNDTFDGWFVITIFTMGWGRLSYVFSNWKDFVESYWFYLPYERYADQIYLFRAMPWKLITIWDGGFLYSAMLAAFLFGAILFIVIYKKWSAREMFAPVALSISAMMSLIFYAFGIYLGSDFTAEFSIYHEIASIGAVSFIGVIAMIIINTFLNNAKNNVSQKRLFRDLLNFLYLILSSYFFIDVFLTSGLEITSVDKANIYIYAGLLIVYVLVGLLSLNQNKVKDTNLHTSAPTRNRAIKSDLFR